MLPDCCNLQVFVVLNGVGQYHRAGAILAAGGGGGVTGISQKEGLHFSLLLYPTFNGNCEICC